MNAVRRGTVVGLVCLALAGCRAAPEATAVSRQPPPCEHPAYGMRASCDLELDDLTDCVVCSGASGCVDKRRNVYCVDATGCEDLRCARSGNHRDDHLLVR
jgi:hypothetical protein